MEQIRVGPPLLALFRERRVFHALGSGERWRDGEPLRAFKGLAIEPYTHILSGHHLPRSMGAFSYSHSPLRPHVRIGRYCSISSGVAWMGPRHPIEWASTSAYSHGAEPLHAFG